MRGFLLFLVLFFLCTSSFARVLSLDEAIRKALSFHPEVKARRLDFKATVFSKKATAARRWLRMDLDAGYERKSDPVVVVPIKGPGRFPAFSRDIYSWELRLSFPIYEGGVIAKEVKAKGFEASFKESLARQSAEDLIANVKQVYSEILYLKELKKIQRNLINALERLKKEARLKYRIGKIAYLDLLYFERTLEEEKAELEVTEKQLLLTKRVLALLMGEENTSFNVAGSVWKVKVPVFVSEDVKKLVEMRSDVEALSFKVKGARAEFERAKRLYYPVLSLFSSYGRRAGSGLNNDEEVWTAGLRLEVTLFDSGLRRNQVREKRSTFLSAQMELEALRISAERQISEARTQIDTAKALIKRFEAAAKYAEEAYKRECVRYRTGAGSVVDLLSAHTAWLRTKAALVKAYYELRSAVISFELAAGIIGKGYLR